jgi:hypothetical protein
MKHPAPRRGARPARRVVVTLGCASAHMFRSQQIVFRCDRSTFNLHGFARTAAFHMGLRRKLKPYRDPGRRVFRVGQMSGPKRILNLFLFFTWPPTQTSDTFSAVKVAPRTATLGR